MNDQVFFHKGLAFDSRSALQQPGFLKTCENIVTDVDGDQTPRMSFSALNSVAAGAAIHSVKRFESLAVAGHGGTLASLPAAGGSLTTLGASFTANHVWRWREYKKFLHGVNGHEGVLIDSYGNCFPSQMENPGPAPTLADKTSGSGPSGSYAGYVSYFITWPNGMQYETGLCPESATVTLVDNTIAWSVIPVSTYAAYYAGAFYAFNNCSLLLNFDSADGAVSATDTAKNRTITFSGNAQIDTAQFKFGVSSLLLDGTGDYVTAAFNADQNLGTAPWRAEGWFRPASIAADLGFFGQYEDANNYWFLKWVQATTTLQFKVVVGGVTKADYTVVQALTASTWYHVCVSRSTTSVYIFLNGTSLTLTVATAVAANSLPTFSTGGFEVGACSNHATLFNGWVDDFSLFTVARTAAFTAPTEATVAPSIKRKLYRGPGTGGTIADIYYVTTIHDNTTTTYDDSLTDAALAAGGASIVDEYGIGPKSQYLEYHYGRLFLVDADKPWRIWYSEAAAGDTAEENENLMPIAFSTYNYDDIRVPGFEKTEPQGMVAFGTNFFVALKQTWLKRQGNDPDTWSWKKTWATHGVTAPDTISICKDGIIYLTTNRGRQCGLALFNGQTSEIFTSPKFDYVFNTDMDPAYASQSVGTCVGPYYHLLYKNTSGDIVWFAVDIRRFPEVRGAYWTKVTSGEARCIDSYSQGYDETNLLSILVGGDDGKIYHDHPGIAVPFDIKTKDCIGDLKVANNEKVLKEIRYNLNTGGEDVILEVYVESVLKTWPSGLTYRTISGTADFVQVIRDIPPDFEGKSFSLRVYDTTGHTTVHIYSPWTIIADIKE
jgi:hypothetical protein